MFVELRSEEVFWLVESKYGIDGSEHGEKDPIETTNLRKESPEVENSPADLVLSVICGDLDSEQFTRLEVSGWVDFLFHCEEVVDILCVTGDCDPPVLIVFHVCVLDF